MSPARTALVALAAVAGTAGAVALLGGCGDDSKAVVDRDATLRLRVDEFRITPENVRTRAGRVHLVVRNTGRLTHNVAVETFSDSPETDSPVELGRTATAHPGETVSEPRELTLKPGKYRLVCTIANHDDLGQYGTLVVSRK